jgi:hypothetical protein
MPIIVRDTEVIDDSGVLQNITGANGTYTTFYPLATIITNTLNFDTPMMTLLMSSNVTFGESNKGSGKSAMLLLDTSSNGYTPTFSTNIKWQAGITPSWENFRYWQIALQSVDGTNVRAIALGYESTAVVPTETITLSGTLVNPEQTVFVTSRNNYVRVGIIFGVLGQIRQTATVSGLEEAPFGNWCNVVPSQTYYIRCTYESGIVIVDDEDPLDTWLALSTGRSFMRIDTRNSLSYGDASGVFRIDIASDSGGGNILATGYYQIEYSGLA